MNVQHSTFNAHHPMEVHSMAAHWELDVECWMFDVSLK